MCLLSTRNLKFVRLLAQIIKLRTQFLDNCIKTIHLDNVGEFTYQAFNDYYLSTWIIVEEPIAHIHTQNGLVESFIKCLQLITKPLFMRTKLHVLAWGHAILHAAALVCIKLTSYHKFSPSELAFGQEPNISHLQIFGYVIR